MKATGVFCRAVVCTCVLVSAAFAQEGRRFNFSAGAGVSFPTGNASSSLNTGWNMDFRGGFNPTPSLLLDLDFSYNHWGLSDSTLAQFGEPGGFGDVWSLTFAPTMRLAPHAKFDPYIIAGFGLYHRGVSLTQPATVPTIICDPFFGFCYPAAVGVNQVVASFSTYKPGFNVGGGIEFRIEGPVKVFAEARYNDMFATHGTDLTYVPLTFGLRW
jgi:opacity protein-like surface antigen